MSYPIYYVEEDDTLPILFDTFDGGTGASITLTGLAVTDIEIYKDGSATQRASDNGYTLLDTDGIDFDGITGIHGFSIDLSDNSDAGFYAVGSWYHVVVSSVTVDSQTVSFIAAAFRIVSATRGMAGTALPDAAADAAGGLPISDAGGLDLDAQDTSISNIETDTNSLNDTKVPDTISLANINGEVDTALSDIGLDHLLAAAVAGTDITDNSIIAKLVSSAATADWDTFDNTTDALQALRDHIGDGTNLTEAGGTGDQLSAVPWNTAWDAEVQSEATDALNAYDPPTYDELLAFVQLLARSDAAINTDRSTELSAINANEGTGAGDYDNQVDSVEANRDNIGSPAGADIAADIAENQTDLDTIITDTNELQGDWTDGGRLDVILDAIKAETDKLDSAHSEPTGVPAANESPLTKLAYLFMALRNQVDVTSTKKTYYDDGGVGEWEKDLSDDGTTYSESEANAI